MAVPDYRSPMRPRIRLAVPDRVPLGVPTGSVSPSRSGSLRPVRHILVGAMMGVGCRNGLVDACGCPTCSHPFGACPGEIEGDGGGADAAAGGDLIINPEDASDEAVADSGATTGCDLSSTWFLGDASWCGAPCGSLLFQSCDVEGLRCGSGCTLDCSCWDGGWRCAIPPCP